MARACLTCRSRKKACDGAKPSCGTCSKSRRPCAGYEAHVKGVFVNLDAGKMKARTRMKGLIRDAIVANHANSDDLTMAALKSDYEYGIHSTNALHTLDLSPAEFHNHFVTLWAHFQARYARSPTCWSLGVTDLGAYSRALDLAFISLATIRLSFSDPNGKYLVMSLSAYNMGLQTFRSLLANANPSQQTKPQLVVISLLFTLFEASQQRPTAIYDSGWAGHLTGALALMEAQGPEMFRNGGFHVAFCKLREMAVLLALSRGERTFLARREWVEGPWKGSRKTWRDILYDIAVRVTEVYADFEKQPVVDHSDLLDQSTRLQEELHTWRATWIESEYPDLLQTWHLSKTETTPSLLPHPSLFPSNDFSYMAIDYLAFLLLVTYMAAHLHPHPHPHPCISISPPPSSSPPSSFPHRTQKTQGTLQSLRHTLTNILTLPCFGRAMSDIVGITEGRCHSLFPLWALSRTARDGGDTQEGNEGEGEGQGEDWWSGTYGLCRRLNYGLD
ncbi:hypothetical protein ASPCAL11851 [Aspergillus calidoustus]|uniref:Zn(2)-C6 fungal-type domain-containing protein n=1 Tax=Aspergillus calidoustus TaxID=454130 RepID=A0A0U5G8S8_ASPCI|nr:hypothetical protein ASPCAL11851 [Aspergillus calidoustus]